MNKYYLQSQIKSTGTAYILLLFVFGTHYAYLGKWGWQILYWITLGGMGFWFFIDIFTLSSKVNSYNSQIYFRMAEIDRREKNEDQARQMAMFSAQKNN